MYDLLYFGHLRFLGRLLQKLLIVKLKQIGLEQRVPNFQPVLLKPVVGLVSIDQIELVQFVVERLRYLPVEQNQLPRLVVQREEVKRLFQTEDKLFNISGA